MSHNSHPSPPTETTCPKCGQPFDPATDEILECPRCGIPGSTKCCNTGGRGCICTQCEEAEIESEEESED